METVLINSKQKKVALIGSNGYIANKVKNIFNEKNYETFLFSSSDKGHYYLNLAELENYDWDIFEEIEYVLILAAISSPDRCEKDYKAAFQINVEGTEKLIREVIKRNCKVIFFSSDAVFGQDTGKAFFEDSEKNPMSAYGSMKKYIEDCFLEEQNFKAIRLSYVFSDSDKFTQFYLNELKNGSVPEIYHPFYRSVICMGDLIKVIIYIIDKWGTITWKVINACGNELVSRVQMADMINRIFKIKETNYKVIEMPNEFDKIRPRVTEMKSYFMKEIIDDYTSDFYEKACMEFEKYKQEGNE